MLGEEPPEVARRHPDAGGELVLVAVVERAVHHELHCAADQLRTLQHDRRVAAIGTAAKAGTVAGGLGGSRQEVLGDVGRRRLRGAVRATVDAGGAYRLHG